MLIIITQKTIIWSDKGVFFGSTPLTPLDPVKCCDRSGLHQCFMRQLKRLAFIYHSVYVPAVTISECVPLRFMLDVLLTPMELACCVIGPIHFYLFLSKMQTHHVPQVERA